MFYRHRCTQSVKITDMADLGGTCSGNDHITRPPPINSTHSVKQEDRRVRDSLMSWTREIRQEENTFILME